MTRRLIARYALLIGAACLIILLASQRLMRTGPLVESGRVTDPLVVSERVTGPPIELEWVIVPLVELERVTRPPVELERVTSPPVDSKRVTGPLVESERVTGSLVESGRVTGSVVELERVTRPVVELERATGPLELERATGPPVEMERVTRPLVELIHLVPANRDVLPKKMSLRPPLDMKRAVFFGCLEGVVTAQAGGRFGNNFMEYASTLGVARAHNLTMVLPEEIAHSMREAFESVEGPTLAEFLQGRNGSDGLPCAPRLPERVVFRKWLRWKVYDRKPRLVGEGPIVLLRYTFQEKYIAQVAPTLRAMLRFRRALREPGEAVLRALGEQVAAAARRPREEVVYIGVHVRRTDYTQFLKKQFHSQREATASYFVRAVHLLRNATNSSSAAPVPLAVVVVSDDMDWVTDHLIPAFENDTSLQEGNAMRVLAAGSSGEGGGLRDLALLSACNHTVLSYGTFGITGAILSGGRAVAFYVDKPNYHTRRFALVFPNWTTLK